MNSRIIEELVRMNDINAKVSDIAAKSNDIAAARNDIAAERNDIAAQATNSRIIEELVRMNDINAKVAAERNDIAAKRNDIAAAWTSHDIWSIILHTLFAFAAFSLWWWFPLTSEKFAAFVVSKAHAAGRICRRAPADGTPPAAAGIVASVPANPAAAAGGGGDAELGGNVDPNAAEESNKMKTPDEGKQDEGDTNN
jgi:hypothetical protein